MTPQFYQRGFGLFGLLITFAVVMIMLYYGLDLLRPTPGLLGPTDAGQPGPIEQAERARDLLEARDRTTQVLP